MRRPPSLFCATLFRVASMAGALPPGCHVSCGLIRGRGRALLSSRDKIVSKEFMRKYLHVAKLITPVLTQEAADHIAEEYSRLRGQEQLGSDVARVSGGLQKHFGFSSWG